jgi:hypothetical protein
MLRGRAEVIRRRQKLEALFDSIRDGGLSPELTAHYARYMCVLVSGYAEQSVVELASHYCGKAASPRVGRYAARQLDRLANVNVERLKQLVVAFDPQWWEELLGTQTDALEAFDSVVALRNAIAHGEERDVTLGRVRDYFRDISRVLLALGELLDPGTTEN